MKKDVKIVIPCYDRFDLLEITLQTLKSFKIPFETHLLFDGMAPEEVKQLAKRYDVGIHETGEEMNVGANEMIYRACNLFNDHVLILDSDVRVLADFTGFVNKNIEHLEIDENIAGISISKVFKELNKYKDLNVMPFNIGCGTIYGKDHIEEAHKIWKKQGGDLDSVSGRLARKQRKNFINSYTVFTEHLGNRNGFHSHIDIVHV